MDNTLAKLIRASRGPVLLMTLGVLLAVHQFSGLAFDRTFPILIIVFGMMWLLERMAPRRAADAIVNVASAPMAPLPPIAHDPLAYDPLREVHRNVYGPNVYGEAPPPRPTAAPAQVKPPVDPNRDLPTAEHPIRQQQPPKPAQVLKDEETLL